jgi:hypothetical protein
MKPYRTRRQVDVWWTRWIVIGFVLYHGNGNIVGLDDVVWPTSHTQQARRSHSSSGHVIPARLSSSAARGIVSADKK